MSPPDERERLGQRFHRIARDAGDPARVSASPSPSASRKSTGPRSPSTRPHQAQAWRIRMCAGELHERHPGVGQRVRGMHRHVPLDEGRNQAAAGQRAVVRDRDAPAVIAARHGVHRAKLDAARVRRVVDVVRARDPMDQARLFEKLRLQCHAIHAEPARPGRLRAGGIDRDHFEIQPLTELQERVVRAHRHVLAAGLRRRAGEGCNVVDAVRERRRREHQVIDDGERLIRAPHQGPASAGSKSSSTRAPFGSLTNTCQMPVVTWRRHTA